MSYKKIGIMGGMFDPVHNGHLSTALAARQSFGLDELRLIPCGNPVHRDPPHASCKDRTEMIMAAIAGESCLAVDTRECDNPQPSYAIDTLQSIRHDEPNSNLFMIVGMDSFNTLPQWKCWQDILSITNILVITRPGWSLVDADAQVKNILEHNSVNSFDEMKSSTGGKIFNYTFTPLDLSSSMIRAMIREGKSPRYLIPKATWEYIKLQKLYHYDSQ